MDNFVKKEWRKKTNFQFWNRILQSMSWNRIIYANPEFFIRSEQTLAMNFWFAYDIDVVWYYMVLAVVGQINLIKYASYEFFIRTGCYVCVLNNFRQRSRQLLIRLKKHVIWWRYWWTEKVKNTSTLEELQLKTETIKIISGRSLWSRDWQLKVTSLDRHLPPRASDIY